MNRLVPEPTRQTAPAPHFPHTEFTHGPVITAACPCGWRATAASHDHSVALGRAHIAERQKAAMDALLPEVD